MPPPPTYCPPPPPSWEDDKLTRKFHLQFEFACRQNVAFKSCEGNIIWNDEIILSIVPTDYNKHVVNLVVYVDAGDNKLQIEGAGLSDSYGLTIDNVKLVRDGTTTNIVVNGGFQSPNVGSSWGVFNNIPGWEGVGIEIGWGNIYNSQWSSQVVELDGHKNFQITQRWTFDSDFKLTQQVSCEVNSFNGKTVWFKLTFDWAARANGVQSPVTSYGNVLWNNEVVGTLTANDYDVHHETIYVKLKPGNNLLQIDGASNSDSYGANVDNVRLTSPYTNYNLVLNGEFENPDTGNGWSFFVGGIPHWKAVKAEVGHCHDVYNSNWPMSSEQCIELDSDSNQRYTQTITISQLKFNQILVSQAASEGSQAVCDYVAQAEHCAEQEANSAVAQAGQNVYCTIDMTASNFNDYLCNLYQFTGIQVKDLHANSMLTVKKYDCLAQGYVGQFGSSYEIDYDDQCFDHADLEHWEGFIEAIHGKMIRCRDVHGHQHYLQIAPCTHFEGQYPLPVVGHKIFWKGAVQPCGKTYVKWATTCNC